MIPLRYKKYIGIPYDDGGRTMEGADCWGLVRLIYANEYGIDLPYLKTPEAETGQGLLDGTSEAIDSLARYILDGSNTLKFAYECAEVTVEEAREGDLIGLNMLARPIHIGLVLDEEYMINTRYAANAVIESYKSGRWGARIDSILRNRRVQKVLRDRV